MKHLHMQHGQCQAMTPRLPRFLCCLWLLSVAAVSAAVAEPAREIFAIQLESAYKPDLADYDRLKAYGRIYTYRPRGRDDGLVRVRLGHFQGRAAAQAVLEKVRAEGFPDAYLSRVRGGTEHVADDPAVPQPAAGQPARAKKAARVSSHAASAGPDQSTLVVKTSPVSTSAAPSPGTLPTAPPTKALQAQHRAPPRPLSSTLAPRRAAATGIQRTSPRPPATRHPASLPEGGEVDAIPDPFAE